MIKKCSPFLFSLSQPRIHCCTTTYRYLSLSDALWIPRETSGQYLHVLPSIVQGVVDEKGRGRIDQVSLRSEVRSRGHRVQALQTPGTVRWR